MFHSQGLTAQLAANLRFTVTEARLKAHFLKTEPVRTPRAEGEAPQTLHTLPGAAQDAGSVETRVRRVDPRYWACPYNLQTNTLRFFIQGEERLNCSEL